ncbi:unnamed protein product [Soboliphyme baturini]|uniref:Uncharacterized protein n=1 Tax=Soboliphyme baturini TaxID=241478 RepID=A0A183IGX3_9BILA|nr:unnamed protein product [Soboliphyme baturini]
MRKVHLSLRSTFNSEYPPRRLFNVGAINEEPAVRRRSRRSAGREEEQVQLRRRSRRSVLRTRCSKSLIILAGGNGNVQVVVRAKTAVRAKLFPNQFLLLQRVVTAPSPPAYLPTGRRRRCIALDTVIIRRLVDKLFPTCHS